MKRALLVAATLLISSCSDHRDDFKDNIREALWETKLANLNVSLNEFKAAKDACEKDLPRSQECVFTYKFVPEPAPEAQKEQTCVRTDPEWPCSVPSRKVIE